MVLGQYKIDSIGSNRCYERLYVFKVFLPVSLCMWAEVKLFRAFELRYCWYVYTYWFALKLLLALLIEAIF